MYFLSFTALLLWQCFTFSRVHFRQGADIYAELRAELEMQSESTVIIFQGNQTLLSPTICGLLSPVLLSIGIALRTF